MRVLLADNDAKARQEIQSLLSQWECTVLEAVSERDVLAACRQKCPDLLLLDTLISGMPGVEVAKRIRQLGGLAVWAPIHLLGSHFSAEEMNQAVEAGVDDFLTKPLQAMQLLAKVRSAERQKNLKDDVFSIAHNLVVTNRALEGLVSQDILTQVSNSTFFEESLEKSWFKAKETGEPLSLIYLNLDYFQEYNRFYGIEKGDLCLKQVANALKMVLAKGLLARLTGSSFAVILPQTDAAEATRLGEKLRGAVQALRISHETSGCCGQNKGDKVITASVGISTVRQNLFTNVNDLKEAADYALYQAIHQGHNRCHFNFASESLDNNELSVEAAKEGRGRLSL